MPVRICLLHQPTGNTVLKSLFCHRTGLGATFSLSLVKEAQSFETPWWFSLPIYLSKVQAKIWPILVCNRSSHLRQQIVCVWGVCLPTSVHAYLYFFL